MKNKKTFELPEFFPMGTNRSVRKDLSNARRQFEEHVKLLEQQAFCLDLIDFFNEFPEAYELKLNCQYEGDYFFNIVINNKKEYSNAIFFNKNKEERNDSMFAYFEGNLSDLDKEKLAGRGDRYLIVKKDNIQAAWKEWMGEENYQKWKSLDMEDKLREHIKPTGEYKQKIKRI